MDSTEAPKYVSSATAVVEASIYPPTGENYPTPPKEKRSIDQITSPEEFIPNNEPKYARLSPTIDLTQEPEKSEPVVDLTSDSDDEEEASVVDLTRDTDDESDRDNDGKGDSEGDSEGDGAGDSVSDSDENSQLGVTATKEWCERQRKWITRKVENPHYIRGLYSSMKNSLQPSNATTSLDMIKEDGDDDSIQSYPRYPKEDSAQSNNTNDNKGQDESDNNGQDESEHKGQDKSDNNGQDEGGNASDDESLCSFEEYTDSKGNTITRKITKDEGGNDSDDKSLCSFEEYTDSKGNSITRKITR